MLRPNCKRLNFPSHLFTESNVFAHAMIHSHDIQEPEHKTHNIIQKGDFLSLMSIYYPSIHHHDEDVPICPFVRSSTTSASILFFIHNVQLCQS